MPPPSLSDEQWEQVKLASIAGIPDSRIATEWGISKASIRKRREREKWPTPKRADIERQKARQALQHKEGISIPPSHGTESLSHADTPGKSAMEFIGKTKEEIGESNVMVALQKLSPLFQNAVSDPVISTPQTLDQVIKLGAFLHKSAGLDKPQTAVQVNLGFTSKPGSQHWLDSAQVVEIEGDDGE